jgi:hypothetical protein
MRERISYAATASPCQLFIELRFHLSSSNSRCVGASNDLRDKVSQPQLLLSPSFRVHCKSSAALIGCDKILDFIQKNAEVSQKILICVRSSAVPSNRLS